MFKFEDKEKIPIHICESDGHVYLSYPAQYKCKICGRLDFIDKGTIKTQTNV